MRDRVAYSLVSIARYFFDVGTNQDWYKDNSFSNIHSSSMLSQHLCQ